MSRWAIAYAGTAESKLKRFGKAHDREMVAVLANLDRYLGALNDGTLPAHIEGSFIHPERGGVIAVDESGPEKDLMATRLYFYLRSHTLHVLNIGDKKSQQRDIQESVGLVKAIRRKR